MTRQEFRIGVVVLLCCAVTASARAQAPRTALVTAAEESVTVVASAPIYVTTNPSSRIVPLLVAPAGTILRTTGREDGGWLQVQFDDPQWGERTGWVEKRHVRVSTNEPAGRGGAAAPANTGTGREAPQSAQAQVRPGAAGKGAWLERVYIAIGGGYQGGAKDFTDAITFTQYLEPARLDATYQRKNGPAIEGSGTVRLWRNLGVSVGFSTFSKAGTGEVSTEIPHPFSFGQTRTGGPFTFGGVTHDETIVRVEAAVLVPVGRRAVVMVGAGPAFVSLTQEVVSSARWEEAGYPYDSPVVIDGVNKTRETSSKTGFSGGIDVGLYFSRYIGAGVGVRYVHAKMPVNERISLDAGGLQAGAGLRFRFGTR
jgi:hypothetical protein